MNSQESFDVVLEMDVREPSKETRTAEMNLWTQHFAALINYMMLEDDRE